MNLTVLSIGLLGGEDKNTLKVNGGEAKNGIGLKRSQNVKILRHIYIA